MSFVWPEAWLRADEWTNRRSSGTLQWRGDITVEGRDEEGWQAGTSQPAAERHDGLYI